MSLMVFELPIFVYQWTCLAISLTVILYMGANLILPKYFLVYTLLNINILKIRYMFLFCFVLGEGCLSVKAPYSSSKIRWLYLHIIYEFNIWTEKGILQNVLRAL